MHTFEIEKGNKMYWIVFLLFIVLCTGFSFLLMKKPIEYGLYFLIGLNLVQLVIMTCYRVILIRDKEYMDLCYPDTRRSYLMELPLFPCNTAEILFLFALIFQSRILLSYCFFMGLIGPVAALLSPPLGFEKGSLFHYRMIGFYGTHYICLMNIPLLIVSDIFIPTYSDILGAIGVYTLFSLFAYIVNVQINQQHLGSKANYFFNVDPNVNPVYKKCYDLIPIPFIYTLPVEVLAGILFSVLVWAIHVWR